MTTIENVYAKRTESHWLNSFMDQDDLIHLNAAAEASFGQLEFADRESSREL